MKSSEISKLITATLIVNLSTSVLLLSTCLLGCFFVAFHFHATLQKHDENVQKGQISKLPSINNNALLRGSSTTTAVLPALKSSRQLHQHTQWIKNNSDSSKEEGLSACLLVNDENPRLPEWLAYHYHTLPLRSLIVAIDPASRSSPEPILHHFSQTLQDLEITYWDNEDYYMPPNQPRGACNANDSKQACLWTHRNRQQHFVMKCMETFKRQNKTWVLLIDVDEYVTFNQVHEEDDPPVPLDEAPSGIPTLKDWRIMHGMIRGRKRAQLFGLYETGKKDGRDHDAAEDADIAKNGTYIVTEAIKSPDTDMIYGNVVQDDYGKQYFLYDDSIKYQDPTKVISQAPPGIPTMKNIQLRGVRVFGNIFNDTYDNNSDETYISFPFHPRMNRNLLKAGNIIKDSRGFKYFLENDQLLWPKHVSSKKALMARWDLPGMELGITVRDVLERFKDDLFQSGICLQMPRLLYGSKESDDDTDFATRRVMVPNGFHEKDFVTLQYQWHGQKGDFETNKFQKTMIDVSRVPMDHLEGKQAYNIHRPLEYFCRADVPRYSTALFRVNHYLDSYEAYTYRNDARGKKRKGCKECYLKKGKGADVARDNDIRPWLKSFVEEVGEEVARDLLAHAGDFQSLSEIKVVHDSAAGGSSSSIA